MSGHSKWSQIKHKKGAADAKRGKLFSKLSMAISVAAREGTDPSSNQRLKSAIEKAKTNKMPLDNIERAIRRIEETKEQITEISIEAYGPEGVALYIVGATDNTNRSMAEIKLLFKENDSKIGEPGSVLWAFEKTESGMKPKYTQEISEKSKGVLSHLIEALEDRDDVQEIWTNASP